jgi:hypothetical protein
MANIGHSISLDAPGPRAADVIEDYSTGIVKATFVNRATVCRFKPSRSLSSGEREWFCRSGRERCDTGLFFEPKQSSGNRQPRFAHADGRAATIYPVSRTRVWGNLMSPLQTAAEDEGLGPLFSGNRLAS